MKAFVNLLIETDLDDTPEQLEDGVCYVLETESSYKVLWSKSSLAKDKEGG